MKSLNNLVATWFPCGRPWLFCLLQAPKIRSGQIGLVQKFGNLETIPIPGLMPKTLNLSRRTTPQTKQR